jgi:hypothetical protein
MYAHAQAYNNHGRYNSHGRYHDVERNDDEEEDVDDDDDEVDEDEVDEDEDDEDDDIEPEDDPREIAGGLDNSRFYRADHEDFELEIAPSGRAACRGRSCHTTIAIRTVRVARYAPDSFRGGETLVPSGFEFSVRSCSRPQVAHSFFVLFHTGICIHSAFVASIPIAPTYRCLA